MDIFISLGFWFHSAREWESVLRWHPEGPEKDPNPQASFTHRTVAGLVFNSSKDVLFVRQKVCPALWKLPGGCIDPDETIIDAASGEVREETGIETEGLGMLGFRSAPKANKLWPWL